MSGDNKQDALEVTPLHLSWALRLNGDGNTFDASCVVQHVDNDTVEVLLAQSKRYGGILKTFKLAKAHFKSLGYKTIIYEHNGVKVRRCLTGRA